MADSDNPRARYENERARIGKSVADGDVTEADAQAIKETIDALDPNDPAYVFQVNGGTETKSNNTLQVYTARLRLAATASDTPLVELDTDAVNRLMSELAKGNNPVAPSDGYAENTLKQYQSALKAFYRYHDDHAVDPEEIPVASGAATSIDERDMFTEDEVRAMREAITDPRERCLFELLAYTGQRIRAVQTLRIKDVDTQQGVFWLNEDADGLKGANGKRPLLGAQEYVRQWLEYHPTGEPDDYLLTAKPEHGGGGEPGSMLSQNTIRYQLQKIADAADVDKKVHPHVFRHYFTTIAKRDYGMDDAHIKRLRGDSKGSNVMETTYRHLSDEDTIEHASAKFEGREPETETALTPEVCPTCKNLLDSDAKACDRCGAVFTPDARAVKDQLEADIEEKKDEADSLDAYELLDKLEQLADENPELLDKLDEL